MERRRPAGAVDREKRILTSAVGAPLFEDDTIDVLSSRDVMGPWTRWIVQCGFVLGASNATAAAAP